MLRFIHEKDQAACVRMWTNLSADPGGSRTIRQRILRPDRTVRWIESTVMHRLGDDGTGVMLAISHDITERRRHERDLRRRALTDPVTGLPNRFRLESTLSEMLEEGAVTVAFVDLDDFKAVNDAKGHHVGDSVLEAIGLRLQHALASDPVIGADSMAGRWGGDEFVLIAHGECEARLRTAIDHAFTDPISIGSEEWPPSCSFGIVHGFGSSDPDALIRSADTAMYKVKSARPN
jgi:diguanylate cyclase (GGDEF)-like protein